MLASIFVCLLAHGAGYSYINIDSLINISRDQVGIERISTLSKIAKATSESTIGRCIEYSLEGVKYGKDYLQTPGLTAEQRDSVIFYIITNYRYLTYAYYMTIYTNDEAQPERAKEESRKILDCANEVRLYQKQLNNPDAIVAQSPELLLVADKASIFGYLLLEDYDMAMGYADNMVRNMSEKGTPYLQALALQNKSHITITTGKYQESLATLARASEVIKDEDTPEANTLRVVFYQNLAAIYGSLEQYDECEKCILHCKKLAEGLGKDGYQAMVFVYEFLDELARIKNDYKQAYEYKTLNNAYKDSVFNNDYAIKIFELESKYKHYEEETEIENLKQNQRINYLRINLLVLFLVVFLFIIIYTFITIRRIKGKNKIIDEQKISLETALKDVSKSMEYASIIQNKIMDTGMEKREGSDDLFVLNKPKFGVGGDFYYVNRCGDYTIIAVADCTGHGVPGALLSVMCISLMNEVLQQMTGELVAHEILEALRNGVKNNLNEDSDDLASLSGMDMALVVYREGDKVFQYSGANRPILFVHEGELYEIKPVRNPLAKYVNEKPFETHTIEYSSGDMIYMFTDGISDQFSEDGEERYGMTRIKSFVTSICTLPIEQQKEITYNQMVSFKGEGEQTDDALFLAKRM